MDSKKKAMMKGSSEMQVDAEAASTATAAVKEGTWQDRKKKKKVTAMRKKAEEPSVCKMDSTVKRTRRQTPVYQYTIPVEGDTTRDEFREHWMVAWGSRINSIEEKTTVLSMCFNDSQRAFADPITTLQVFSVKISPEDDSGLEWPLDVYGIIAARDLVDYKRNIIFERGRDNCQTITEGDPYLSLTGPTRAVVLLDPVYFEVDLKVKGSGKSQDQDLIFLAQPIRDSFPFDSCLFKCIYTSKMGRVELTFGHILKSVEATITMEVIHGSWPDVFGGTFAARTASVDDMVFPLLLTGDNKLPVADDGMIKLTRNVVCRTCQGRASGSLCRGLWCCWGTIR